MTLLPVFQDLIKPQWRMVLEELKRTGGLPASDLARTTGVSYMATKTHCEELTELGYVIRTRLPRTEVGRPEIFYSLAGKAQDLFPQAGAEFTLGMLDDVKRMFGESAPEKLLFQYFQKQKEIWNKDLTNLATPAERAAKLAKLRSKGGYASTYDSTDGFAGNIIECHNPLQIIFDQYPRAATLEQRMIEELLGTRVTRTELEGGRESPPRVSFALS